MASYRITRVQRGTKNAACLGFDETVEAGSIEEARECAVYHGECAGIDLGRYEPLVEPWLARRVGK